MEKIIDRIIQSANLRALPEAEKIQFRERVEAQITRRLGLIIFENLGDKGFKDYEAIAKNGQPDKKEMKKFLEKYVPDYKEKLTVGMDEFFNELMRKITK